MNLCCDDCFNLLFNSKRFDNTIYDYHEKNFLKIQEVIIKFSNKATIMKTAK